MKPISFLSFDVEALPGRADKDHVDRLIWGKIDGHEYGIRRICSILNDYNIKGNFLLDFSGCAYYGDRAISEIGKYILSEGHELHTHLHVEWLIRSWGIKGNFVSPLGLDQFNEEMSLHFLKYVYFKYRQLFGSVPEVFRSGGYLFNQHTVNAARCAGFKCLSNFNAQRHEKILNVSKDYENNEPFSWGEGLVELPVDFSPEPLSFDIAKYFGMYDRVLDRKKIKTFNLTMHSWSLLRREDKMFTGASPEHEAKLRHICEHLCLNTQVLSYSEYLKSTDFSLVTINSFNSSTTEVKSPDILKTCTICDAIFATRDTDICPGCKSKTQHHQVIDAIAKAGNPFIDKRVLACYANTVEKLSILAEAKEVKNFDIRPVGEVDFQMDIQRMNAIPDESYDGFLALHVLNHVKDDHAALNEIYRVLKPKGVALITVPYRTGEKTTEVSDRFEHYGVENFEKYGVGSYRRYGFEDVINLFSNLFIVKIVNGFDPVCERAMKVFILEKSGI